MKVLQIINGLMRVGGAEKFVLDLTLALNSINDVTVECLSISSPRNNDYVDVLIQNKIEHHILSDTLYSLKNIWRLKKLLADGNYDVVHVHLFPAFYYAALAKTFGKGSYRLIYTEHSTYIRRREYALLRIADRYIYRMYDTIVGISDKVKTNLKDYIGFDGIKVINNGVDLKAIEDVMPCNLRDGNSIGYDATIVTMVSRITEGKDFTTLIRAIELLPARFHVVFVGDGPQINRLKNIATSSIAKDRIHILGLRTDVYGIIKASDILVLSTRYEGFSIAMLEAMACNKPFVASDVEGIRDLVAEIAVLFEYQDSKCLARTIEQLAENKCYYRDVAERCYLFASKYDIRNVALRYLSIYSKTTR